MAARSFGVSQKAAQMICDIFYGLCDLQASGDSYDLKSRRISRETYGEYLRMLKFWDGCDENKWIEQCENIDADPVTGIDIGNFAKLYTKWKRPLPADHVVIMTDLRITAADKNGDKRKVIAANSAKETLRYAYALKAVVAVAAGRKHYTSWDYCVVCGEDHNYDDNPIVFCSGCDIAVHRDCYGAPLINQIPDSDWICQFCLWTGDQSKTGKEMTIAEGRGIGGECRNPLDGAYGECVLCPVKGGALKRTTDWQWMHISCGLWIPEVFFINGEAREPISYFQVPDSRFDMTCQFCGKSGPEAGACLKCSWSGCTNAFHICCGLHVSRCGGILETETNVKGITDIVRNDKRGIDENSPTMKENDCTQGNKNEKRFSSKVPPLPNRIHLQYTPGKNGQADIIVGYCSVHSRRAKRKKKKG
eukprot:g5310.t1